MLSFNIKSIYSTLQYLIDLDNWKHPEKLNAVIDRLIAPLVKEEKLPELYVPKICSNLRQLLLAIVQNNHLVIVLGVDVFQITHNVFPVEAVECAAEILRCGHGGSSLK